MTLDFRRSPCGLAWLVPAALILTLATAPAAAARGEAAPASAVTVNEEEFLAPLVEDPRVLAALYEEVGVARAGLARARAPADPEVGLEREMPDAGADETSIRAGWRPPLPGRRGLRIAVAEAALEAAEARSVEELAGLVAEWRGAFARWAVAGARVEALTAHHRALAALAERTRARAEAGEASGLDARRLALAAGAVATSLAEAEAERLAARAAARTWRPDLPPAAEPVLPDGLAATAAFSGGAAIGEPGGGADSTADSTADPAALAAAKAEARSAELAATLAGRWWELPEIEAGWKREEASGGGAVSEGPVVGLAWTVPLPGRRRAAVAEAEARRDAARSRAELLRQRREAEVEAALAAYRGGAAALRAAERSLAEAAPAETAARAAFDAGEVDLTGLLDVLAAAHRARLDRLDLTARVLAAHRRYLRLTTSLEVTPAAPGEDSTPNPLEGIDP